MKRFFWIYLCLFLLAGIIIVANTGFKEQTSNMMASITGQDKYDPPDISKLKDDEHGQSVRKGLKIMSNTSEELPNHVGNNLSCISCHATGAPDTGKGNPNSELTFVGVAKNYPDMKDGKKRDLKDRINGCMMRSMDGKKLPKDSEAMNAMANYLKFLSKDTKHADSDSWTQSIELDKDQMPKGSSVNKGRELYKDHCVTCHGPNGNGIKDINTPALWGKNSYKQGAGMSRNTMAAAFIKRAMPKDDPGSLNQKEAASIAKYINSHDRPGK